MSSVKPIIRELFEAALKGFAHAKSRLHQVMDNLDGHFDDVMRQVKDKDHFDHKPSKGPDGKHYSVAYEMTLDEKDWAKSRKVHFNRANAQLDAAMKADPDFRRWMESQSPGVSERVAKAGGRQNPNAEDFIWHHAHPDTVQGRYGVMHLVPKPQHTPGSIFWGALHPDNRGGFSIWGQKD